MKPHKPVYLIGGDTSTFLGRGRPEFIWRGHPDYGTQENPNLESLIHGAILQTLDSTGVSPKDIDRGFVSNFLGECFSKQGHLGSMAAGAHPDLEGKPFLRVEAACASGSAAIAQCIDSLQAGCDVVLAVGAEVETNVRGKEGVEFMALAAHYEKERDKDFALFPHLFARRAKHYKEAFGATSTDIARVVDKAYRNAHKNPKALNHHTPMDLHTAEADSPHNTTFLGDERYKDHIRLNDCTKFTDGASAAILATEAGLAKLGVPKSACTQILSYGWSVRALGAETDPTALVNMADAAAVAFKDGGVEAKDIDIAEVHDCFSIAEIQMYEALGFAERGEGTQLLRDGATEIDGRLPVNTGGGLLGFGHPIGATGIKQAVEIWRQMKGKCGEYQVKKRLKLGLTANLGGDDRTGIVMIHRNCE